MRDRLTRLIGYFIVLPYHGPLNNSTHNFTFTVLVP
jgi:hypothetical protein